MMNKPLFYGIRWQLFCGFGALVFVISLFYARLTFLFVEVTEDIVASYVVQQELELSADGENINVFDNINHLSRVNRGFISAEYLEQQSLLTPTRHDQTLFRFNTQKVQGYATKIDSGEGYEWFVINAKNLLPLATYSEVFGVFLGAITIGAFVLAVLSTWFLASRLSAPLRQLTQSVGQQRPGSRFSSPINSRSDEIGLLALAFERTYGELQKAWKREHDFASDVSHELRTPIALIRNTLSLNSTNEISNADKQLLNQSTDTLQNTVEVLLAIARKENLVFSINDIKPIVERTVLALIHSNPDILFEVDVELNNKTNVSGNPHLIGLLCQNLINNGYYHGGDSGMRIYQQGSEIVFENPIPSKKADANYQGLGHGQYLVRRITEVMGWQMEVNLKNSTYQVLITPKLTLSS
ncbi:HAMP domain-containing sensor histidine kinase [Alteromonas sp. KUL49]|uniref:sensor histidine kinase n=1 Tax=Alteromonas sp. KUL49 TaxID=2480798 RepID=UPI00102EFD1F|nr:HAMP domain-containing sensor histidine kinase [Alteromonas sp. KUL49]TAP40664.1 HAMP domain-containing histidine kinase [Alteromonas sp. KUL49]